MATYQEELKQMHTMKLRELLTGLPPFCFEFFRGIEQTTSIKTRIAYAYDLKIFFEYLIDYDIFVQKQMKDIEISDLDTVSIDTIEEYIEYLTYYSKTNEEEQKFVERQNDEKGKARKISSIRAIYKYFYKKRKIKSNPTTLIELPKIHEKNIVRLEADEVAKLLDEVESGEHLTDAQKKYHERTRLRDIAIITLLLGTGIRVSECVGISITDIDFDVNGIKITRKGGNEVIIYFGDEVRTALLEYIEDRNTNGVSTEHEQALFLSMQNKRISVRAVQMLVKKYAQIITKIKKISPHKLRSTYGTNLYKQSGDIYLVADVLGHKDVNTTRKHYAQMDDERRRSATKYVKLRQD